MPGNCRVFSLLPGKNNNQTLFLLISVAKHILIIVFLPQLNFLLSCNKPLLNIIPLRQLSSNPGSGLVWIPTPFPLLLQQPT
jgi:hypothetical protein